MCRFPHFRSIISTQGIVQKGVKNILTLAETAESASELVNDGIDKGHLCFNDHKVALRRLRSMAIWRLLSPATVTAADHLIVTHTCESSSFPARVAVSCLFFFAFFCLLLLPPPFARVFVGIEMSRFRMERRQPANQPTRARVLHNTMIVVLLLTLHFYRFC